MRNLSSSPRLTLFASALGFVVVLLDVSVVNVALDSFRQSLHAGIAALQWVVNAYSLVFAALLLTSGAMGDQFGSRRVFILGFAVFTLASLGCGLSPDIASLLSFRLLQGLGAALLVPNSLALLQQAYRDPAQRSRAVGIWGASGAVALAAGPVIGGLLVAQFGWRSIFLVNIPVGLVGLVLARHVESSHQANRQRRFDWAGQTVAVITLASLAAAMGMAADVGWAHAAVMGGICVALAGAVLFIAIEARSTNPMLPLDLFHNTTFSVVSLCGVVVNFAYYGLLFVLSLFFQVQMHLSAEQTGLAFLPMTLVLMVANLVAGHLMPRWGVSRLMVAGLMLAAAGYGWLMVQPSHPTMTQLALPMLLAATGIALTVPTMTNATLSSVESSRAGIASGVLNSARQVGGMLGVAICGYLVRNDDPVAFVAGMHRALAGAVVLLVLGAVLCVTLLKPHTSRNGRRLRV